MNEYMLVYVGGDTEWKANETAESKKEVMARWSAWFGQLSARGQLVNGGSPLAFEGRRIVKDGVVTDIAASELKELVSGYSIIKAKDYDEACALAKECPIFRHPSSKVDVRRIIAM